MFPVTKKLTFGEKEVTCMDFTYGYLIDIEAGLIKDTVINAILNATELSEEDIKALRKNEVDTIYQTILKLNYPELYDEDGNMIDLPDIPEDDSKKKV